MTGFTVLVTGVVIGLILIGLYIAIGRKGKSTS
jgi:hypothetical protein